MDENKHLNLRLTIKKFLSQFLRALVCLHDGNLEVCLDVGWVVLLQQGVVSAAVRLKLRLHSGVLSILWRYGN